MKTEKVMSIIMASYILSVMINAGYEPSDNSDEHSIIEQCVVDSDDKIYHEVLATKYNAVESQCDSDPLITADNSKINLELLDNYELKWVAISRDLKEHYKFGDTILVSCNNPRLNGKWVVRDVMNKRFTNRIDFLCPINDNYKFDKPINVTITRHGS